MNQLLLLLAIVALFLFSRSPAPAPAPPPREIVYKTTEYVPVYQYRPQSLMYHRPPWRWGPRDHRRRHRRRGRENYDMCETYRNLDGSRTWICE